MTAFPFQAPVPPARPKVALVLGSGGLNSLAALPLIEFLEDHRIHPEVMVGCSGASITLALWACGFRGRDLGMLIGRNLKSGLFPRNWHSLAIMLGVLAKGFDPSRSLFKTGPLLRLFGTLYGDRRLEEVPIPLVLQATDFDTGEGVEQASGRLVDTVYASCAAYPFLHPIQLGGRWLFDGMYSAPLPILPAVRRDVDLVLAMDFSGKLQARPTSFFEAMIHVNKLLGRSLAQSQMLASLELHNQEILQIKVRTPTAQPPDMDPYEWILGAGRRAVEEYGPEILAFMGNPPDRTPG
jgi:NTE family protein